MEKNKEPRNKPRHIWSVKLHQRDQEYKMGKAQFLQLMVLGKLDSHMQKNETQPLCYTIHEYLLKMY